MDTGSDFIRPEFLNILFFQQKNLVIFPYVDLKHLHALEIFTAGYNVVDLESTALHNLKEILEFEATNTYSQNPTLYFIYNIDREKMKELMELDGIRCIINSNENVSKLANGSSFIFFNKKNNQFLNYGLDESKLELENYLIEDSQDEEFLQEKIHKIKIVAKRIFKELNQSGNLKNLPNILGDYSKKYWKRILEFTGRYYDINIPDISTIKFKPIKVLKDYSNEYEELISTNRALGKEFIHLLHDYRSKKVNPAHLEIDELYNPRKLYNYLRNHHWSEGIPEDFIQMWTQMEFSNYKLTESDQLDLKAILERLGVKKISERFINSISSNLYLPEFKFETSNNIAEPRPSPKTEWNRYKDWIEDRLTLLEKVSLEIPKTSVDHDYFYKKFSEILLLLRKNLKVNKSTYKVDNKTHQVIEKIKKDITSKMKQLNLGEWIKLFGIKDKYRVVVRFIAKLRILHAKLYGKDNKEKDMPIIIRELNTPLNLQKDLRWFSYFRNEISHNETDEEKIARALETNENRLNDIYLHFLAYLIKTYIVNYTLNRYRLINSLLIRAEINRFIIFKYLSNGEFSVEEINKLEKFLELKD